MKKFDNPKKSCRFLGLQKLLVSDSPSEIRGFLRHWKSDDFRSFRKLIFSDSPSKILDF